MNFDQIDPRLIDIFKELISIEGLSGNEKFVANYIKKFLGNLNLTVVDDYEKNHPHGNSGNLICKIGDGGNTAFLAHMDTARSTKDVVPVISNGRIQSNGKTVLGVDNRAGIAIILYTVEKIVDNHKLVPNLTLAFTICEETSLLGSSSIALDNIDMAYVFDSALRPGNFISQSYGAKSFKIIVNGKASHSGIAPEKGINAIQIAAKAINNLRLGKIDNYTTLNIGKINGGESVNVVPPQTTVYGEIRSLYNERIKTVLADVEEKFTDAAKKFKCRVEITSSWDFKPYKISTESKVYKRITDVIKKIGLEPNPAISAGGSDANSLNKRKIPTINIGIGAQNPHSEDEFILLEDLHNSTEIALHLVKHGEA